MRARISSGRSATSRPSTVMRPLSGLTKPSSVLISVLLPAPFGPSSPTAPARNCADTSLQRPVLAVADADLVAVDDGDRGIERPVGAGPRRVSGGGDDCPARRLRHALKYTERVPGCSLGAWAPSQDLLASQFLQQEPADARWGLAPDLQRPSQPERVGVLAHERDDVGDVLIERQPDLLGAGLEVLARDRRGRRPCPSSA